MYKYLFLYAPCTLTAFCSLILLLKKKPTDQDRALLRLSVACMVYFFVDACYVSPALSSVGMIILDIIGKTISLTLLPLVFMYLSKLYKRPLDKWFPVIAFSIPVIMCIICTLLYGISGMDEGMESVRQFYEDPHLGDGVSSVFQLQYIIGLVFYNAILALEGIALLIYTSIAAHKLNHMEPDPHRTFERRITYGIIALLSITILRIGIGYHILYLHPVISCILSGLLALSMFYAYFNDACDNIWLAQNHLRKELMEGLNMRASQSLQSRFERLMLIEGKCYEPSITLEQVAQVLNTNRTTLADMIKQLYSEDFSHWVNFHRIERAKTLLRDPQNFKQEIIAAQCGYTEASVLNRKFKQTTGMTPRAWLYSQK